MKSLSKRQQNKSKAEQSGVTIIKKVANIPVCDGIYVVGSEVEVLNARDDESNTRDGAVGHRDGIEHKDDTEDAKHNGIDQVKSVANTSTDHKRNQVGIRGKFNKIMSIMQVRGLKKIASSRESRKEPATCRNHIVKLMLRIWTVALFCSWVLIQARTFISQQLSQLLLVTLNAEPTLMVNEGSKVTQVIKIRRDTASTKSNGNHDKDNDNQNLRDTNLQNATQKMPKHNLVENNNFDKKELQIDDVKTLQMSSSEEMKIKACFDVADEVLVTECGLDEVNGTYIRCGYSCGATKYLKTGQWKGQEIEIQIYRVLSKDWYICIPSKYTRFYHAKNYGSLPPAEGWKVIDRGVEPTPMISISP